MRQGYVALAEGPVVHHFAGDLYARQLSLRGEGHIALGHAHTYDHLSILATGVVKVTTPAGSKVYCAPAVIQMRAGVKHEIEALSEGVEWFCVHVVPESYDGNPEHIDKVLVKET